MTQDSMICTLDIQMGDEISYCLCKGSKRPKTLMLNSYLHKPLDRLRSEFVDIERFYHTVNMNVLSKKDPPNAGLLLGRDVLNYQVRGSFDDRTLVCLYRHTE